MEEASFVAETFRPEKYLRNSLSEDSQENILSFVKVLNTAGEKSVSELRKAVFKSNSDFLELSKLIVEFGGSLTELKRSQKDLLSSFNNLTKSADIGNFNISSGESRNHRPVKVEPSTIKERTKPSSPIGRSSIDNEARQQKMTNLIESIADFEKHVTPDRYLIFEGGGFTEVASSISSGSRPIILYLFNDAIAITTKKTRLVLSSSSKKQVLERFWLLSDVSILDIPDSKNFTNLLKLSRSKEDLLLQVETPTAKRLWIQQILKTQKNLTEGLSPSPTTISSPSPSRDPSNLVSPVALTPKQTARVTSNIEYSLFLGIPDISPEIFSQIKGLMDKLNEEVDKCNYDPAVELIDKIRYELSNIDPRASSYYTLNNMLELHIKKLCNYLYHEISDLIIGKEKMSQHIQRLLVLGLPDEAKEKFLSSRSEFIRERIKYFSSFHKVEINNLARHLRFNGDTAKTVNDIGFAVFSGIETTANWYITSFKDNTMTAGFVFWSKVEITNYVNIIAKQVFTGDLNFRLIGDCIAAARRQCSSLKKIGLDFIYYLDDLLMPHVDSIIAKYQQSCENSMKSALADDDFLEDKVQAAFKEANFGKILYPITLRLIKSLANITTSVVKFYQTVLQLLNDVEPILTVETSDVLVNRVSSMFEHFSTNLLQSCYAADISNQAFQNVIGNIYFLANEFLTSLTEQLESRFGRTFGDLSKLYARLQATVTTLVGIFADINCQKILPQNFDFYSSNGSIPDDADISSWLTKALPILSKIGRDSNQDHQSAIMSMILSKILERLSLIASDENFKFGEGGVQQFILDIHFLLVALSPFMNDDIAKSAAKICVNSYESFRRTPDNRDAVKRLKPNNWYDLRARELIRRYPMNF